MHRGMRGMRMTTLTTLITLLGATWATPVAARTNPAEDAKLRVLVDKVLMRHDAPVMSETNVREIAAAGFNVVSPRWGNDDLDEVRRVARLAQENGMRHMPWMRGTLSADSGVRLTWANGKEQDLYSPNSEELWAWMSERILGYARLSVEIPALMGVFLDFENYAPGRQGNAYALSYDGKILAEFAQARGIEPPALAPEGRKPWLEREGLLDDFRQFQFGSWRQRCRQLRRAVDAVNPAFQFCVYPAPGTPFIRQAAWSTWGTKRAPLILADASTYGRPAGLVPHAEALESNRQRIERRQEQAREGVTPLVYLGGIDPIVRGADPEFSGKNAVMLADVADGYWVFYEGPTYGQEDHAAYWRWFTWANRMIAEGRFESQDEPRESKDLWCARELQTQTSKPQLAYYGLKSRMVELIEEDGYFEVHELCGISLEYLRQLDVVVLQNFNVDLDAGNPWVRALRAYVREGGGLMLAHDTAWFMASPLPEIAVRGFPIHHVEAVRHVVDTRLQVTAAHPALDGLQTGTPFITEFMDHMIFTPGDRGKVIVENQFGDPVYVVGEFGEGHAAFSGSYYGYSAPLAGPEKEAFLGCLKWLAEK